MRCSKSTGKSLGCRVGFLIQDERGQTAVEYIMVIAVVVIAMAMSMDVLLGALATLYNNIAAALV